MIAGLNKAYEVKEERPLWRVICIALGLMISLTIMALLALAAMVYSSQAEKIVDGHLGAPALAGYLGPVTNWAVVVILFLVSFAVLYRFGPNLKDCRWQWSSPGAVIAVALWFAITMLLRVYHDHFSSFQTMYGGLNAVATLLLWLYLTAAAIFIGGQANSEIEKAAAEAGHSDVRATGEQRAGA
jgi:membrane protein